MKENKRKESNDRRQKIIPIADEKCNSLLQKDKANNLANHSNRYNPLDHRIHQNGNNSNLEDSESLCNKTCCCVVNKKYLIISVILIVLIASVTVGLFVYFNQQVTYLTLNHGIELEARALKISNLTSDNYNLENKLVGITKNNSCFQLCPPKNFNEEIRERYAIKQWVPQESDSVRMDGIHCSLHGMGKNGTETTYTLFPYPTQEPKFDPLDVGEELLLSHLIRAGQFEKVRDLSKVDGTTFGTDILSYSGFITIEKLWKSHLFFWFFPAQPDENNYDVEGRYTLLIRYSPYLTDIENIYR